MRRRHRWLNTLSDRGWAAVHVILALALGGVVVLAAVAWSPN